MLPAVPAQADGPPPNDDFADAIAIGSVPFEHLGNLEGSTREDGEPDCDDDEDTVWYSFSSAEAADLVARVESDESSLALAVYSGSGPHDLRELACEYSRQGDAAAGFLAEAGVTYFIQVGWFPEEGTEQFRLVLEEDPLGKIGGTVTDEQGQPIDQACATAWTPELPSEENEDEESGPFQVGYAGTDALGRYHIGNLPSGDYRVEFVDCGEPYAHLGEWYDDQADRETSDVIHVEEGATTQDVDAALAVGGGISGLVTDETGVPAEGVCVTARLPGRYRIGAPTGADGRYQISGLMTGTHSVVFVDEDYCGYEGTRFLVEWYDDKPDEESSDPVEVIAGSDTPGIDAQLIEGAAISGRVTDGAGNPIAQACVSAQGQGNDGFGSGSADENGMYRIQGLPGGSYLVEFRDCSGDGRYMDEWYDDQPFEEDADPIQVVVGEETVGINASLAAAGSISGMVTDEQGNPLPHVCVDLRRGPFEFVDFDVTHEDGIYRFGGLPPGDDYIVGFEDCDDRGLIAEWYDNKMFSHDADSIAVGAGEEVSGIDAELSAGGALSGVVTDDQGAPLEEVCVSAFDGSFEEVDFAFTDELGEYRMGALPSGQYRVEFSDCAGRGFRTEWFEDRSSFESADVILVEAGEETTGVDAALSSPGVLIVESGGSTAVSESGAFDTYTVRLEAQPSASVTVAIAPGPQLTTTPTSLSFTTSNWSQPKTVTVRAVNDSIAEGNHTGTVSHSVSSSDPTFNGKPVSSVSVAITDNDVAGVVITESGGSTALAEGGATDTYTVKLGSQPVSDVTLTLTPDQQVTAAPSPLVFTAANWSTARTVTVTAVDDAAIEGPHSGVVTHAAASADPAYQGIPVPSVTASITDNDTTPTTLTYTGPAGGFREDTVTLSARLTPTGGGPGIAGRTITFRLKSGATTLKTVTALTGADGVASAPLVLTQSAGFYTLESSFAGDATYVGSGDNDPFGIQKRTTVLEYSGPSTATSGDTVSLSALLFDEPTVLGIPGRTVVFRLMNGSTAVRQSTATTDPDGVATSTMTLTGVSGSFVISASFDGDGTYAGSSDGGALEIEVTRAHLEYLGPSEAVYAEQVEFSARLTNADTGEPLSGKTLDFRIVRDDGAVFDSRTITTGLDGVAHRVTYFTNIPSGYRIEMSYAGEHGIEPSFVSADFTLHKRPMVIAEYDGPTSGTYQQTVTMRARIEDPTGSHPLEGRHIAFKVGEWTSGEGYTDANGWVEVEVSLVGQPGPYVLKIDGGFYSNWNYEWQELEIPFEIKWEYVFDDQLSTARIGLNPSTGRLRYEDGTTMSPIYQEEMTVTTLPSGDRVVVLDHFAIKGVFHLDSGRFVARVSNEVADRVMLRMADEPRVDSGAGRLDLG